VAGSAIASVATRFIVAMIGSILVVRGEALAPCYFSLMLSPAHRFTAVLGTYAAVVRNPSYFPLWLGQLISNFGDTLHYIAMVVLVYQLTGQGAAVAILVTAEIIPVLVLGPIAGVIVDRFSRKSVLIASDLFRAALVLSLVWPQNVWHAYLVGAGLAAGNAFFNPTMQAVIPALMSEDQRLAANSVAWSTGRLVQIIASALAGGLIAIISTGAAFALNATSFVVSALLIARITIPPHAGQVDASARRGIGKFFADAREGLRFGVHDRLISRLLPVQILASLATGASSTLLIVLAERHLRLPPAGFAWLIAAVGVGALLGPLIPNTFARDYRDARWLFVPYVIRGIGDVLIAAIASVPVALVILFVYGLNTSSGMVVFSSTLQSAIPEDMRGRVFTLFDVTWSAARLLSLAIGAALVDVIGIRPVYWLGGSLLVVAGITGLALLGRYDFRHEN
jgi:MFS family permease